MIGRKPEASRLVMDAVQGAGGYRWPWRSRAVRERPNARGTAAHIRPNLFARMFGGRASHRTSLDATDSLLLLAHDWLRARGGKITHCDNVRLEGVRRDGTIVRYTVAPDAARQDQRLTLLAFGTPAYEALAGDIARHTAGLALCIDQAHKSATEVARAAFAKPSDRCEDCSSASDGRDQTKLCFECLLRNGKFRVVGAGRVRATTIDQISERRSVEFTFRLRIKSSGEQRDELVRVAVDAATGVRIAPLDVAILRTARAIDHLEAQPEAKRTAVLLDRDSEHAQRPMVALAQLQPAIHAAARLARAQALPDYQRLQDDIVTTFHHLLREAPASGQQALAARDQALTRLAETHTIEAETQLVAAATIITPLARVRVGFARGITVPVDVDVARAAVDCPRCAACGAAWRMAATCDAGHVTCLNCQKTCVHCGARQCDRCDAAGFAACTHCGKFSCEKCARATARGRHRVRKDSATMAGISNATSMRARVHDSRPTSQSHESLDLSERDSERDNDDLSVADCEVMTQATWREFLRWYCREHGLSTVQEVDVGGSDAGLLCRHFDGDPPTSPPERGDAAAHDSATLVIGHRPTHGDPNGPANSDVTRMLALARQTTNARVLLITTALVGEKTSTALARGMTIVDRTQLAEWLVAVHSAYQRQRGDVETAMQARATAADRVRALVMNQLRGAVESLEQPRGDQDQAPGSSNRLIQPAAIDRQVSTARQALTVLETLVEDWDRTLRRSLVRATRQQIDADHQTFVDQYDRAEHVLAVLREATAWLVGVSKSGEGWLDAIRDELREGYLALAERCRALDPMSWQGSQLEYHDDSARASVEHLAASKRAARRARQARDRIVDQDQKRVDSGSRVV